ncbi:hypothetical protein, partial [Klebsiella pneumoniae]
VFSRLAECGSTTGQLCWSGAEGVQCCYAFDVKALKGFNAASQQGKEAYWQQESTGELAGEKVVLNQKDRNSRQHIGPQTTPGWWKLIYNRLLR